MFSMELRTLNESSAVDGAVLGSLELAAALAAAVGAAAVLAAAVAGAAGAGDATAAGGASPPCSTPLSRVPPTIPAKPLRKPDPLPPLEALGIAAAAPPPLPAELPNLGRLKRAIRASTFCGESMGAAMVMKASAERRMTDRTMMNDYRRLAPLQKTDRKKGKKERKKRKRDWKRDRKERLKEKQKREWRRLSYSCWGWKKR
jgi:hypothetical protein